MKLTTQRLKKLIREAMDNMSKIRKMVMSGEEGYNQALMAAAPLGIPKEEVEKIVFELPYGQRPKWALRLEIKKVQEDIKNSTNEREKYELQQYLEGLEEELYDY